MTRRLASALLGIAVLAAAVAGAAYAAEAPPVDRQPAWQSLSRQQQQVLAPLQRDWSTIDSERKQKWLEVARRFPSLPEAERQRIQDRMTEWARMTPVERGRARLQFQQSRQIPAEDRQARWEAYKALPDEERQELARRARPTVTPPKPSPTESRTAEASAKRNIVPPAGQAPVKQVAPTLVQAKPGVTTSLMTEKSAPPSHQQPGLPKIAAMQDFVDPNTLLPRRGPQGAAVATPAPRGADTVRQ